MKRIVAILLAALMAFTPLACISDSEAAGAGADVSLLVDFGNGTTEWYPIPGTDYEDVIGAVCDTLARNSVPFEKTADSEGLESVNGKRTMTVGGQVCSWRFYYWNSFEWDYGDVSGGIGYSGESLAIGFYPGMKDRPVETPLDPDAWTCYKGDSRSSSVSGSFGPATVATPLEWHIPHTTGGVYSSLLYANGLRYHTTGGDINGTGTDRNPSIYCIDTVNHEVAWEKSYVNRVGYEVSTPIIVGDLLIVTSSNGHIYALDRFDGSAEAELVPKGEMPHFASKFDTTEYSFASCYDADHNWLMEGNYYATGPTTCVYDSGALYFNTFDGLIRCYSVSQDSGFRELWTCQPGDGDRGSFYCMPPVIAETDGRQVVLSGNYAGKMYCVDAESGDLIWVKRIIDNRTATNTNPGCVSNIIPCGDGRAIVNCDDGEMSPSVGHTVLVDLTDGTSLWTLDILSGPGPVIGDTFYTYSVPANPDAKIYDKFGNEEPAKSGYYAIKTDTGRYVWINESGTYTKSGMVFCDNRLYCLDYAPGTMWPQGGAARCIDPDTGTQIWRVKLEPFYGTGYSMSTPTVVDGKVYVANDSGIIYCISEKPGVDVHVTDDIEYESGGFLHWTWLALFGTTALLTAIAVILYRRG